ncbi:uncharacterized protein LOC131664972 [Phymastichus coffea]|uniref:uncharacterized protein LOC131664972 n=1 Tax=Phymastichus coffea TaxID=108790 RepID=UPI00273C7D7F|nr:uncharacterized protein LOC131664972 [Phymastichus coffea]
MELVFYLTGAVLVTCVVAAAVPVNLAMSRTAVPYWHVPCGSLEDYEQLIDTRNVDEEMSSSLKNLRIQHELLMNDYLSKDYEFLYERVRIGVHEHQYIPNWLPGKKDVHVIKRLKHFKPRMIINHLPKLHSDLQKFAVALEEMVEDETWTPKVQDALKTTQSYLKMMLCEVESSIILLPGIQLPGRIERGIMSETEREPVDDTRRLVRDWGILLKYKDYLHAWRHVFDY